MFKLKTKRWGEVEVSFQHRNPAKGFHLDTAGTSCFIESTEDDIGKRRIHSGGEAMLHPLDTNSYCKETGRKLSLTRALHNLGASREERAQFWNAYFFTQELARQKAKENNPPPKEKAT
jgi:hypothetical protein